MYWFLVMRKELGARRGELNVVKGRSIGAAPWVEMGLRRLLVEAGFDLSRDGIRIAPVAPPSGAGINFGLAAAQALEERRIDGFWANGSGAEIAVTRRVGTFTRLISGCARTYTPTERRASATPTSSATAGSIRTGRRSTATSGRSLSGPPRR
jgi:ABC-type nitrate/sulfonate/bicarbonate transport system substrate-binding protein